MEEDQIPAGRPGGIWSSSMESAENRENLKINEYQTRKRRNY